MFSRNGNLKCNTTTVNSRAYDVPINHNSGIQSTILKHIFSSLLLEWKIKPNLSFYYYNHYRWKVKMLNIFVKLPIFILVIHIRKNGKTNLRMVRIIFKNVRDIFVFNVTEQCHLYILFFQIQSGTGTNDNTDRLDLIDKTCKNDKFSQELSQMSFSPELFSNIVVNDQNKFLLCNVPKIGSSSLKHGLLVVSSNLEDLNLNNLTGRHSRVGPPSFVSLDHFTKDEIEKRLNTYYKFMFAREPLERLLSAYNSKFASPKNTYFPIIYGRKIIRDHRKNASQESRLWGHDVTLDEFIDYLLASESRGDILDGHWCHYYRLCHPCLIKYNFIGRFEHFMSDADKVLNTLHLENIVRMPNITGQTTRSVYQQMYSNISSEKIHQLWQMYRVDFEMFGYPYPQFS